MKPSEKAGLETLLAPRGGDVGEVFRGFRSLGTRPLVALDRLDERLEKRGKFVFVTYDELDSLGGGDWDLAGASVSGLVAFWAAYSRRWQRIRGKLFLRTDLYERHAKTGGADLAKLAAGRVELSWSDRDLYGLLLKRLANFGPDLARYVKANCGGISLKPDNDLGLVPELSTWEDGRPIVENMVGMYMGTDRKKGLASRWLLDHVRDGLGRAFPRPLVRLVEEAARHELQQLETLRKPRLIQPASLRRALDRVSGDHVVQSLDEWPWLEEVKRRLKVDPLVPWDADNDVIRLLGGPWPSNRAQTPPAEGRELLDYLLELGVLRRRADGRVDVPDLFLAGLKLRRKGGVRKKR